MIPWSRVMTVRNAYDAYDAYDAHDALCHY